MAASVGPAVAAATRASTWEAALLAMSSWGSAQAAFGAVMAALASEPSARQLAVLVAAASRGAAQGASQSVENTEGLGIVAELEEYLSILKVQSVAQVAGQLRQRGRADLASRLRKVAAGRHPIAHPDVLLKACLLEITDSATSTMEEEPAQGIVGFDNMETTLGMALEESGGKPPNKANQPKAQHRLGKEPAHRSEDSAEVLGTTALASDDSEADGKERDGQRFDVVLGTACGPVDRPCAKVMREVNVCQPEAVGLAALDGGRVEEFYIGEVKISALSPRGKGESREAPLLREPKSSPSRRRRARQLLA